MTDPKPMRVWMWCDETGLLHPQVYGRTPEDTEIDAKYRFRHWPTALQGGRAVEVDIVPVKEDSDE